MSLSTSIAISSKQSSTIDSNSRRKRSSNNYQSNSKLYKFNPGRWKARPNRPQLQLSSQEKKQAAELLRKFSGRKDFSLPIELPPWSPPPLEDITPELRLCRDYGFCPSPTESKDQLPLKEESTARKPLGSNSNSASPETYSSPPLPASRSINGRKNHSNDKYESESNKASTEAARDRSMGNFLKGKERGTSDIDWAGWEIQNYETTQIEQIRQQYERRAKELKRLSDSQRAQISAARGNDPTLLIPPGMEELSDLATVEYVDSLLLFTQSFLCLDLLRSTTSREHFLQWDTMTGFLSVAKSTARKSGIELTYAICLMYESLLLDRLVEAERPLFLQTYSHASETEKQLEGFKKFKRILGYQEIAKSSWLSAEKIFDRIFSSSSCSSSSSSSASTTTCTTKQSTTDKNYKSVELPRLKKLIKQMKVRDRYQTPKLLSLDRPYKFCWPIDKSNPDSMADFVVFSRCALDEFLEINQDRIRFKLSRFDDSKILFPNLSSKP